MEKLPIGIQNFKEIRKDNYIYIDKTKEAYDLITTTKYAFLSRPRRFGKSLFVDTLKCIFEGRKELFEGLYIYDKWDWDDIYHVIKISWSGILSKPDLILSRCKTILQQNQERLGIKCKNGNISDIFDEMIIKIYEKYNKKVVILIDEYDKPILDNIVNGKIAEEARDILRGLYSVMKDKDEYIRFVFLTGVSKFSKTSIFSGLNMLEDITLNPDYGNICGYTQHDLDTSFADLLQGVDKEKVKVWYNGYNFLKDNVYNPFDILQFIRNKYTFHNYWFESGTPSFLIKLINEKNYYLPNLSNLIIDKKQIDSYDIDNMNLEILLFQSGYLTIDRIEQLGNIIMYHLRVPNLEVEMSLNDYIYTTLYVKDTKTKSDIQIKTHYIFLNEDLVGWGELLKTLFASIPYNNYVNNNISDYEGFYASVVYSYLHSFGFDIVCEDVTSEGRIDLTIRHEKAIYVIEFKVGNEDAMEFLKQKNYHLKYMNLNKPVYLIGINFNKETRNIEKYQWEKIK